MEIIQEQMECPACGSECLDRRSGAGLDHESVTVAPDRDEYEPGNPLKTCGGYVLVELECIECGLEFDFVIANHKGTEYTGIAPVAGSASRPVPSGSTSRQGRGWSTRGHTTNGDNHDDR
jgi:hypothetical protein